VDEGAGGGGGTEREATGGEKSGDAGTIPSTETVLSGDQAGGEPGADGAQDGEATKDDKGDGKDKKPDDAGGKKDDKPGDGTDEVPEDGKYTFDLPKGVKFDEDKQELWSKQFKDTGLTRAQAQKLVQMQSEQVLAEQKAFSDFIESQQKTHLDAAKKDKDIGGDKWAESTRLANLGLKALGGGAIKNLILTSGNGNNPEMIRELRRIGEMVKDDKFVPGASTEAPVKRETAWYGETTPDTKKG